MSGLVLDLFAGAGGWSEGARMAGVDSVGLELDPWACRTRVAAGHATVLTDIAAYPAEAFTGKVRGLIASPPCFPGDTPVLTRRGLVPIDGISVGDEVWTHASRWKPVLRIGRKRARVVRVKGQGTSGLEATPDHRIWTRTFRRWRSGRTREWRERWGEPEWTPASDCARRRWAMPVRFPEVPREWGMDPWLAGRWLADGWASPERGEVCWAVGNEKRTEFASRCPDASVSEQEGCARFTLYGSGPEAAWLLTEFGNGAARKTLPSWLFGAPHAERQAFLDGYLSGDSHEIAPGVRKAVTVSRTLACGIRILAASLGYDISEVRNNPPSRKTMHDGRVVRQRPWYAITVRTPNPQRPYVHRCGDHAWMTVRRVEDGRECEVVDIEVADDHSFVADGIVVHNCQTFSQAGQGEGVKELAALHSAIEACRDGWVRPERAWADARTPLILEPLRWAWAVKPEWIACEQVPPCLPVWEHMADVLRAWGYDAAALKLSSEQFGVPQTRLRAFLLAHREGVRFPTPTHQRYRHGEAQGAAEECQPSLLGPGLLPWVSMAEALGWEPGSRAWDRRVGGYAADAEAIPDDRPAPTVTLTNGRDVWRQTRDSGPAEEREPRELTEPSYTIRAAGSGKHPSGVKLVGNNSIGGEGLAERDGAEPALTVGSRADLWRLRVSNQEKGAARPLNAPASTVFFGQRLNEARWVTERPATTIAGDPRVFEPTDHHKPGGQSEDAVRITLSEAAVLQSFPPDYPFQGTKSRRFRQVGNAIPPLMAKAVFEAIGSRLLTGATP